MNQCHFCGRNCGEREFCDVACYDEHQHDLAEFQASVADELPVGESRYDDDGSW